MIIYRFMIMGVSSEKKSSSWVVILLQKRMSWGKRNGRGMEIEKNK